MSNTLLPTALDTAISPRPVHIIPDRCNSVSLSVCLCIWLSFCVCLCISLSACLSLSLSVCLYIYLSLCICLCISLSVRLSVCLCVCLLLSNYQSYSRWTMLYLLNAKRFPINIYWKLLNFCHKTHTHTHTPLCEWITDAVIKQWHSLHTFTYNNKAGDGIRHWRPCGY